MSTIVKAAAAQISYALRLIRDRFPVGPSRGGDAQAEIEELLVRYLDAEGTNGVRCGRSRQL